MSLKSRLAAARARILSGERLSEQMEQYGEDALKSASKRSYDPYPTEISRPPRFAKDRWGLTSAFSGPNRHERRREAAAYRQNFYRFAEDGHRLELARLGQRSRLRKNLRERYGSQARFSHGR